MIQYDIILIKTIPIHNKVYYWIMHTIKINNTHFIRYTFN